jgi:hypothetical protein
MTVATDHAGGADKRDHNGAGRRIDAGSVAVEVTATHE